MSTQQPGDGAQPRRIGGVIRRGLGFLAHAPVSITFTAVIIVMWSVFHRARGMWAAGAESTLTEGHWWTLLTGMLLPGSVANLVVSIVLGLTLLVFAERLSGSRHLVMSMLVGGVTSVALGVAVQSALARWPGWTSVAEYTVADPTIAIIAGATASSAFAGVLWRRRMRLVGGAVIAAFALYAGDAASWFRLGALIVGYVIGELWVRGRPLGTRWRSSLAERRSLIAGIVAIIGAGPFAALASDGGHGPLSFVESFFTDVNQRIVERCAVTAGPFCDHQTALLVTRGAGPALMSVMPLVLLLVAAVGLRAGRRSAMILGILTSAALALASAVSAAFGLVDGLVDVLDQVLWAVGSIGLPLIVILLLVINRRAFTVRADPASSRRLALTLAGTFVGLLTVFMVVGGIVRSTWSSPPSFGQLFVEGLQRFLPPAMFFGAGRVPVPHHGAGLFLWQWIGVVFWIVAIVGIFRLYSSARVVTAPETDRYRDVVRRTDGGSLEWIGTWQGTRHWFTPDGEGAVAYRVESGVALAIADPICLPERRPEVVRGFVDFVIESGWIPAFYSVHDETRDVLVAQGWEAMTVAEETVILSQQWTMAGKAGQAIRHPVTRMQREGVTALWTTWQQLEPRLALRIREISEQWVAEKSLPEMGFTLGSVPEMQDPEVRLMLALSAEGDVLGFTSWLPSFREGALIGWTLDVMRRSPDAPNGVMEFLIASAVLQAQEDGIPTVSLSGAPLTFSAEQEHRSAVLGATLGWMSQALEPLYGFASLFRFKKKFRPEYRSMSLVYTDPLQLPQIGTALGRAYLPTASRSEVLALARGLFDRSPAS